MPLIFGKAYLEDDLSLMNVELLYVRDLLFVSWQTQFGAQLYWHRKEKEIQIGYLSLVYG